MTKALSIVLITAIALFSFACHEDGDIIYTTTQLELSNADNSGQIPVQDNDSVPIAAYAIRLFYTMELVSDENADSYESDFRNEDPVTNFEIKSPNIFDGVPAFTNLNSRFNYSFGQSIGDEIGQHLYTRIASGRYPAGHDMDLWHVEHYVMLMDPPQSAGDYRFIIDITFRSGRVLSEIITVKLF